MDQQSLQTRLSELLEKHEVPGASIGVLHEGNVTEAAAGVINQNTGVETTTDTLFQIGSISKVWTTTVVMQLVDEGKLDLDAPVRDVIGDFAVADEDVAAKVTLRHLLSHTERHRRRPLPRLRTGRRLPREVRRCDADARSDTSARRDDVLLQHRLLDRRKDDRADRGEGLGPGDARARLSRRSA